MIEQLIAIVFWLIMLVPIGIFVHQIQQVRRGTRRKIKGTILFFFYSTLPVLAHALVCLALIGIEEFTKISIVPEGLARTFLLFVGIGLAEVLLLTVFFAISVCMIRVPIDPA